MPIPARMQAHQRLTIDQLQQGFPKALEILQVNQASRDIYACCGNLAVKYSQCILNQTGQPQGFRTTNIGKTALQIQQPQCISFQEASLACVRAQHVLLQGLMAQQQRVLDMVLPMWRSH